MSIKNLKPNPNSRYKQGEFDRFNPRKYFGPRPIIYRSSYEFRFMQKVELNPAVVRWSSENIVIPYTMKKKKNGKFVSVRKNYNIDFTVFLKDGQKIIVEVKPSAFSPTKESQINSNPIMYQNACKWKAAIAWCKANGYVFRVITEKHLKTKIF